MPTSQHVFTCHQCRTKRMRYAISVRGALCISLLCFPAPVLAGTSHGNDENLVIIGLAIFFALLLGLYVFTRRMRRMIHRGGQGDVSLPAVAPDTNDTSNTDIPVDHSGLHASSA